MCMCGVKMKALIQGSLDNDEERERGQGGGAGVAGPIHQVLFMIPKELRGRLTRLNETEQ